MVLPGGADWNLQRTDGAGSVEAAYYLKTDDGVLIRIVNKGIGPFTREEHSDPKREKFFMFTQPQFEVPTGKYDWLTHGVFVATLGARPEKLGGTHPRVPTGLSPPHTAPPSSDELRVMKRCWMDTVDPVPTSTPPPPPRLLTVEFPSSSVASRDVTWRGVYMPEHGKEKDANDALSGIYKAGLDAIKAKLAK